MKCLIKTLAIYLGILILVSSPIYSQNYDFYFKLNINGIEKKINFAQKPLNQIGNRKIISKTSKKILEIGGINDSLFYAPVLIKADVEENFYVLDQISKCVKKFSSRGKLVKKYGREGSGPGEFQYPTRLYLDIQKNVYVYDSKLNRLSAFREKFIGFQIKADIFPTEFCPLDVNNLVILKYSLNSFDILEKYNFEGQRLMTFKTILNEKSRPKNFKFLGHIFMGNIIRLSSKRFVHIPECFNQLFFYNDNKIEKIISTIDNTTHPILDMEYGSGYFHIPYKTLENYKINIASFLVGKDLFIFSKKGSEKNNIMIDVYNSDTGAYKYSLKIFGLESFIAIEITGNKIYLITEDLKIKVYSY